MGVDAGRREFVQISISGKPLNLGRRLRRRPRLAWQVAIHLSALEQETRLSNSCSDLDGRSGVDVDRLDDLFLLSSVLSR